MRKGRTSLFRIMILILPLSLLAACETAEQRAERYYQSALELVAAGDYARATVEFRNVFKLNGEHRDARAAYAEMRRSQGEYVEAIGQYLRLVEQYPDDYPANVALSEMYARLGRWDELERFTLALARIAPDDPVSKALNIVRVYNRAVLNRDPVAADAAAAAAAALRADLPAYVLLHQVVADDFIRRGDFEKALAELDGIIAVDPDLPEIYSVRLSVLGALGDGLAIEEQLRDNIDRFPGDSAYSTALVRFFVTQNQLDEAEAFLRERIAEHADDVSHKLTLLRFLTEYRGNVAALEEVDLMIAGGQTDPAFQQLRAGIIFDLGETQTAQADLADLAEQLGQTEAGLRVRVSLAKLSEQTGDDATAQTIVDEILQIDSRNVEALKIRANWQIRTDRTGEAIVGLRTALEQSPEDPQLYQMLASAHAREGDTELVGEMLALASQVSGRAPDHTARYARHLIANQTFGPAETALLEALRRAPTSVELLSELGNAYIGLREWGRLQQVIATLRNLPEGTGGRVANDLQARVLLARQRTDEALAFLTDLIQRGEAGFDADVTIVSAQLQHANAEGARAYLAERMADAPDDAGLAFLMAATETALGNLDAAEALYRRNIQADAAEVRSWLGLFRLLQENGRETEARQVAASGLQANPDSATMLWVKASLLEYDGDISGAVEIYRGLYEQDSNNLVVANNLASLMVELAQDPTTVNEAFVISRRLRASTLAAYQDTYGWIAVLRGDFDEAVRVLEPAAEALADDPAVQYHLARAYLGRKSLAKAHAQFVRVTEIAGASDDRPFVADARARIEDLAKAPEVMESQ